jgi:hypothetical protein
MTLCFMLIADCAFVGDDGGKPREPIWAAGLVPLSSCRGASCAVSTSCGARMQGKVLQCILLYQNTRRAMSSCTCPHLGAAAGNSQGRTLGGGCLSGGRALARLPPARWCQVQVPQQCTQTKTTALLCELGMSRGGGLCCPGPLEADSACMMRQRSPHASGWADEVCSIKGAYSVRTL